MLGLDSDGFPNEDKMTLHLVNLAKAHLGDHNAMFVDADYTATNGKRVLTLCCWPETGICNRWKCCAVLPADAGGFYRADASSGAALHEEWF